ncbi:DUF1015 domain-containing protein [Fundicoccus sp. Sow4_H7]|uniref:DUF1015 domain-containing protein n=1 Tax=Fundicoccus sp. Sow4_H7 TaxID=3438784 RepID=UPI003F8DE623
MVKFKTFKAIRPNPEIVEAVVSLPYDVINRQEAINLVENNPYSYLHIDRSEVDLPELSNPYADEVYAKAAENLTIFLKKNWLQKEEKAMFYIYELNFLGQSQTGLVGTASVEDYLNKDIKKHEFTRYEKEIDRIRHMDACDANTSPVFLTYRGLDMIDIIINNWKVSHPPIYDFESFHDTHHKVWIIDNNEVQIEIQSLFENHVPSLYIADGHHRTESAAKVSMMRQESNQISKSDHYFLAVAFPIQQLRIFDYNRIVKAELPANFLMLLEADFEIEKVKLEDRKPFEQGVIALYFDKQWYHLRLKADRVSTDIVDALDASIAQKYIFAKVFGIEDPRQDHRIDFVGGIRGLDVLEEAVDKGVATLAVALYSTNKEDLLNVADLGEVMPPKSTWFEPKLLSGLFVHDLESKT